MLENVGFLSFRNRMSQKAKVLAPVAGLFWVATVLVAHHIANYGYYLEKFYAFTRFLFAAS